MCFVKTTSQVTFADLSSCIAAYPYPGAQPDMLVADPAVFRKSASPSTCRTPTTGEGWKAGVAWRHQVGPESTLRGRECHPVVQVSYTELFTNLSWAFSGFRSPCNSFQGGG
jgi:sulfatase modifying factor 1